MIDQVTYSLKYGPVGTLVHAVFVRKRLVGNHVKTASASEYASWKRSFGSRSRITANRTWSSSYSGCRLRTPSARSLREVCERSMAAFRRCSGDMRARISICALSASGKVSKALMFRPAICIRFRQQIRISPTIDTCNGSSRQERAEADMPLAGFVRLSKLKPAHSDLAFWVPLRSTQARRSECVFPEILKVRVCTAEAF